MVRDLAVESISAYHGLHSDDLYTFLRHGMGRELSVARLRDGLRSFNSRFTRSRAQ